MEVVHPLAGIALKPWAFEQIMRMKEQYDPNAYEVGAACPTFSIVGTILKQEVAVPDPFGFYEDKMGRYRIDVKPW